MLKLHRKTQSFLKKENENEGTTNFYECPLQSGTGRYSVVFKSFYPKTTCEDKGALFVQGSDLKEHLVPG